MSTALCIEQAVLPGASPWVAELLADGARRLPRRPYCTDDLEHGLRIRRLEQALGRAHIQVNPPTVKLWLVFDIDRPGAAHAWEDAGLPMPTWTAINPANGHAHLAWGLAVPVRVNCEEASEKAMRYLAAIEGRMAARLGADLSYGGLTTKNPLNPRWIVNHIGRLLTYDLDDLAEWLPELTTYRPPRRAQEQAGTGRNVHLFIELRKWAYRAIRDYWRPDTGGWDAWVEHCRARAMTINLQFPTPLHWSEVRHVAKSVARWVWKHTTQAGYELWRTKQGKRGGKASGAARRAASAEKRARALELHAVGMSQRAIATELEVNQSTVARWLVGGDA